MTEEELSALTNRHLRLLIGDLVIRVAQLSAENDALKAGPQPMQPKGNGHADHPATGGVGV